LQLASEVVRKKGRNWHQAVMNTTSPAAIDGNSQQGLKGIRNREGICAPHLLSLNQATKSSSGLP